MVKSNLGRMVALGLAMDNSFKKDLSGKPDDIPSQPHQRLDEQVKHIIRLENGEVIENL